jgi:hypothetical protein
MISRNSFLICILCFLQLFVVNQFCLVSPIWAGPNLQGPSGLITVPTAPLEAGVATLLVDGNRLYKYNVIILNGLLEAGMIQNQTSGDQAYHLKVSLMEEGWMMPSLSIGAMDISSSHRDDSRYIVLGKNFSMVGLALHGGLINRGRVKDVTGLINYNLPAIGLQSVDHRRNLGFIALEFSMLPLVSLMGEYVDKTINAGIRFRPTSGITIDWNFLDVKDAKTMMDRKMVNLKYQLKF